MRLENEDIILRELQREDAYTSVKWRNNPQIWKLTLNSPNKLITIEDELSWIDKVMKEKDSIRLAIIHKHNYVGNIQLTNIVDDECYYGIFLGDMKSWGKGIAKTATILLMNYAFTKCNLKLVRLRVRIEHHRAFELYRKIGFLEKYRDDEIIYMELSKSNLSVHE